MVRPAVPVLVPIPRTDQKLPERLVSDIHTRRLHLFHDSVEKMRLGRIALPPSPSDIAATLMPEGFAP